LVGRALPQQISATSNYHIVMRGHSRSKNGVASLAYDPRIHADWRQSR